MTVVRVWDLPDKERYCVRELLPAVAKFFESTEAAARMRIYRRITNGSLPAKSYLGSIRISREDVEKIFTGEDVII